MQEVHAVATYGDMLRLLAQRLETVLDAKDAFLSAPDGSTQEYRALISHVMAIDRCRVVADAISWLYGVGEDEVMADAMEMLGKE
ncbi:hypothetical protein [Senegalimassilia sp.]